MNIFSAHLKGKDYQTTLKVCIMRHVNVSKPAHEMREENQSTES